MRLSLYHFCFCILFFCFLRERSIAQSCITFQPSYSIYTSESTDGKNIYTSTVVDGSGNMTVNRSLPGCGSLNVTTATHTPIALNVLTPISGNGTTVGGMQSGASSCPTCYLSVSNNQSVPAVPGQEYTFSSAGEVMCSAGGSAWGSGFPPIDIELAETKSKWNNLFSSAGGGSLTCYVTQWCTIASQPPACNPSFVIQAPLIVGGTTNCRPYYNTLWLAWRVEGTPWNCFPLIPGQNAIGTDDSTIFSCTK